MPLPFPTISPETEEIVAPELDETFQESRQTQSEYRVVLYNDDYHDFDEVILQVQKATGCSLEKAEEITILAHVKGREICFRGSRDDCSRVCRVLREIRLQCEIDCD